MKIKKGDKVQVLLGKDRGKTGTVDVVFQKKGLVLVSGINIYKKHLKPRGEGRQKTGGIIDQVHPLKVSKVGLICPKCGKVSRVGFLKTKEGKTRICHTCKGEI